MSLEADIIVDRRRMRRKLTFWRALAILLVIVAVLAIAASTTGRRSHWLRSSGDYIARVTLTGLIRNDRDRVEALDKLAKSDVKAVIVDIDSPGGTTAGSEQLYDALHRLAARKPIVMVVDGLAASGAYIAAIAGDHIIAHETSLVGSIGVLFQFPNFGELLKTVGVKVEEIKSSPLKAAPNGFEPTSPEARAAIEAIVRDSYAWFRALVQDRRHLDDTSLDRVADGRVFTGRQAIELKLVDQLGDERSAVEWLAKEKGIDPKLPVHDWQLQPRLRDLGFLHLVTSAMLDRIGFAALARRLEALGGAQAIERVNLDGLLALWHPSPAH
jgi:protease IV